MNVFNEGNRIKRDYKSMSLEELDEYISKNKKGGNDLNSSFQSNSKMFYSNNLLLNLNNNNNNSINNNKNENQKENFNEKLNASYFKETKLNYIPLSTSKDTKDDIVNITNKLKGSSSILDFKANNNVNFNNTSQHETSIVTSKYIKSLQDELNQLRNENIEIKENFNKVSELLNNERKTNEEVNLNLKDEINNLIKKNKNLNVEILNLKSEIGLQEQNLKILSENKDKHIETNFQENEELNLEIENLKSIIKEKEKVILKLEKELLKFSKDSKEVILNLSFYF